MKKGFLLLALVLGLGGWLSVKAEEPEWQDLSGGNFDFRSVWVNPGNPKLILAGCRNGIVRSEDGGASWRNTLSLRGDNRSVNFITVDRNNFYACTGNGLFSSNNQGRSWKRIFKGRNSYEADCQVFFSGQGRLFLGTKSGLFVSRDQGRIWQKLTNKLGDSRILAISIKAGNIYAVCAEGVFKSNDNGDSWEKIYSKHSTEISNESEEESEDRYEDERSSDINYLALDQDSSRVYLATANGVKLSRDEGRSWEDMSDYGLLSKDVRKIFILEKSRVCAITKSGIFTYQNDRWVEQSFNLTSGEVRFVTTDNSGTLYAACEKGLFRGKIAKENCFNNFNVSIDYFQGEPKISEVQKAAMKYAEVEPEKIINWRKQAARKALLPELSVGAGRNTTDLWHWEGGSTTKTDDDTLRKGNDSIDWDVALSWNLGELIWNEDQTSIDNRSRLMVQLRDDIMDEVNKAYFERIRLKEEINNLAIEDRKKRFEKELRLLELTATLDSLTGGFFSQSAKH